MARGPSTRSSSAPTASPRNGDAANKIGTYRPRVLARAHGVPFYVAAPSSTSTTRSRAGRIPIEERAADEVAQLAGADARARRRRRPNPAFDVTPAANITAIVTEAGVHRAPYERSLPGAAR